MKRSTMVTCTPTTSRVYVQLKFEYDPALIAFIRTIPGALFDRRWYIPHKALVEFADTIGMNRIETDDEGLRMEMKAWQDFAEPTEVSPNLNPQFPTWTALNDPVKAYTAEDFQAVGTTWLVQHPQGIFADDMGLGKTKQFVDAVWHVYGSQERSIASSTIRYDVLVVCKAINVDTWRDEITKWCPQAHVFTLEGTVSQRKKVWAELTRFSYTLNYVIVSYETFCADSRHGRFNPYNTSWDWIALDEAHKVKSSPLNGNQSQIAQELHELYAPRMHAITGTPIINAAEDAWNILYWLGLETREFGTFAADTLVLNELGFASKSKWAKKLKVVTGYKPQGMILLRRKLRCSMLRRMKRDKLPGLPAVTHQTLTVNLNAEETRFYNEAMKNFVHNADGEVIAAPLLLRDIDVTDGEQIPNKFVQTLRLTQITSSLAGVIGTAYRSTKIKTAISLAADAIAAGQKVLIFSQFRSVVAGLVDAAIEAGFNPAVVEGGVHRKARADMVRKFQEDSACKVFIGTSAACREGLTLTAGSYMIHLDEEWAPAYVQQLEDRICRIGQTKAMTVVTIRAVQHNGKPTVDDKKTRTLARKDALVEQLVP
jgi:SNF2 family DNA or RNA helicase